MKTKKKEQTAEQSMEQPKKTRKIDTKTLVGIGLFTAIVVVLQMLGGGIKVGGMFSISLVLIPIVVGAAVYGWKGGAWLGFAFGVAVLASGDAGPFLAVNPLATVLVVLVKGAACGFVAGLMYKLFRKYNQDMAVMMAAIFCPMINTGIFLVGCALFFYETISGWATAAGFANAGAYMILGLAGINFLVELAVNILLAPVIVRLIRIGKK